MQPNLTLLVKHQYDALNRLVATTPTTQAASQRFYMKDRLTTEIQGAEQRSIMQHDDQLLAQQQSQSGSVETRLHATDLQRSVLNVLDAPRLHPIAYAPYGHRPLGNGLLSLLGFNGERQDPVTGWYLLGTGYHRPFNPVLMRFNSPDSWSPFGRGGLNAYAYCSGDPVNRLDPTGHSNLLVSFLKGVGNRLKIRTPTRAAHGAGNNMFRNPLAQPQTGLSGPSPSSSHSSSTSLNRSSVSPEVPVGPSTSQTTRVPPDYISTVTNSRSTYDPPPAYSNKLETIASSQSKLINRAHTATNDLTKMYKAMSKAEITPEGRKAIKTAFEDGIKNIHSTLWSNFREFDELSLSSSSISSRSSSIRSSFSSDY